MFMIKASVNQLQPGQKPLSALLLLLGSFLRWVLMGGLLFLAVKMHILYALLFILAFTTMRMILIVKLHRQTKNMTGSAEEG